MKLLIKLLLLGIPWMPATAGAAKPTFGPPEQPQLWILPKNWLKQDPGVGFSPIITTFDLESSVGGAPISAGAETMIEFRRFMGGNATIIQLNDIPVEKPFKFANFERGFTGTGDLEAFMVDHLKSIYATTILDLSHPGGFSAKDGDFQGYLRTRRMSALYPEAQFISFGPIALRIDNTKRKKVGKVWRPSRRRYRISTNDCHVVAWAQQGFEPGVSYTYNPAGNVSADLESDLANVITIRTGPNAVQEFDSRFFARRTRQGLESPLALDRAIEKLWGSQFTRYGPMASFEEGTGLLSDVSKIRYGFEAAVRK